MIHNFVIFFILGKDIIPELVIPHKRRVWFEDQRKVKDVSFILTAETLRRLPVNRTIILNRGSGYQVCFIFTSNYNLRDVFLSLTSILILLSIF